MTKTPTKEEIEAHIKAQSGHDVDFIEAVLPRIHGVSLVPLGLIGQALVFQDSTGAYRAVAVPFSFGWPDSVNEGAA